MTTKLKTWTGNLDGAREGLVIAPSKKRAREVIGTSRGDFEDYWREQPDVTATAYRDEAGSLVAVPKKHTVPR